MSVETSRRGFLASMGALAAAMVVPVPLSLEQAKTMLLPAPVLPDPINPIGFIPVEWNMIRHPGDRSRIKFAQISGYRRTVRPKIFLLSDEEDITVHRELRYLPTLSNIFPVIIPQPVTVTVLTHLYRVHAISPEDIVEFKFDPNHPVPFSIVFG